MESNLENFSGCDEKWPKSLVLFMESNLENFSGCEEKGPKSFELFIESNLENFSGCEEKGPKSFVLLMESNLENLSGCEEKGPMLLFMESNLLNLSGCEENPLSCMLKESNLEKLSKLSDDASLYLGGEFPNLESGVLGTESSNLNGLFFWKVLSAVGDSVLTGLPPKLLDPKKSLFLSEFEPWKMASNMGRINLYDVNNKTV